MEFWNDILLAFLQELVAIRQTFVIGGCAANERQAVLTYVGESAAQQWLSETSMPLSTTDVATHIQQVFAEPPQSAPSASSSSGTARTRENSRSASKARRHKAQVEKWAPSLNRR